MVAAGAVAPGQNSAYRPPWRVVITIDTAGNSDAFLAYQGAGYVRGLRLGICGGGLWLTAAVVVGRIRCSGCRSVAQLGRASVSKTECRGFESCRSCQTRWFGFIFPLALLLWRGASGGGLRFPVQSNLAVALASSAGCRSVGNPRAVFLA